MNYKEIDREKVLDFLKAQGGECEVSAIIAGSGAEKLRVYSLLFEEQQAGHIEYVRVNSLGAPEAVKLV